jgi:DNA-binding transcriptional ArsR family regulator
VAELRALAHPLRLRILELFAEAPRTTKQVADLLGQPPTRLYHHVAALERAGLLVLKETRQVRGATEKWYEATARRMGLKQPSGSGAPAGRRALTATALTILEQSRQEVAQALRQAADHPPLVVRLVIPAPLSTIAELRTRLAGMVKEIRDEFGIDEDATPTTETPRWAFTLTYAPVWPQGRGKAG